jgi:hypothetical protein
MIECDELSVAVHDTGKPQRRLAILRRKRRSVME